MLNSKSISKAGFFYIFKVLIITLIILPSSSNSQEKRWYNSNVTQQEAQSRFNYDSGRCVAEANMAYPDPAPMNDPRGRAPALFSEPTWDYSGRNSNGVNTNGTIRQRGSLSGNISNSLNELKAYDQYQDTQRQITEVRTGFIYSCMNVKGWHQE